MTFASRLEHLEMAISLWLPYYYVNHIKSFVHGDFVCWYHDAGWGDYLIIFK